MARLNDAQRAYFFAIREFMDRKLKQIAMSTEAEFNAAAETINEDAIAIRMWKAGVEDAPQTYERGDIRLDPDDGVPYWTVTTHTSYAGAELQPSKTPSMWTHCHGTTPETAREFMAEGHNPYQVGHYCKENGKVYCCNTANTVHAPSVYAQAWNEVETVE